MALKLPRLPTGFKLINSDGSPTNAFQLWWQNIAGQLETNINAIQAALEAADIAIAAAESAQNAADAADAAAIAAQAAADAATTANQQTAAEQSLANSGVVNEAAPLTANLAGNITVADHQRIYGNPTLNPTVAVDGDVIGTAYPSDETVYVFYDDPTRAGGAVSYLTSNDPADALQAGNLHSIGVVTIPSSGTSTGTYTRPSGIPS